MQLDRLLTTSDTNTIEPLFISVTHINGTAGREWIDVLMAPISMVSASGTTPLQRSQVQVTGVTLTLGPWDNQV
jgi:hypothetical protein